jgi:hypothetical protein
MTHWYSDKPWFGWTGLASGLLGAGLCFLVANQKFLAQTVNRMVYHTPPGWRIWDVLDADLLLSVALRLLVGAIIGVAIGAGQDNFRRAFWGGLLAGFMAGLCVPGPPRVVE